MKLIKFFLRYAAYTLFFSITFVWALYFALQLQLPDVSVLENVQLQTPLRIYSIDGELIAQFGEKQRLPVALEQIPIKLIQAFIAVEDRRFYSHYGIDPRGILRAVWVGLSSGHLKQGASTITQQLARNFFLSSERTFMRKIKEIVLAIRIERCFSKDKIFELYLNKIYLGQRAYGVEAAAQIYFGKTVEQLDLSEIALLAGLPRAPSTLNPLHSTERAAMRRNLVLMRMFEQGYITQEEFTTATQQHVVAYYYQTNSTVDAPHLAEMVRQEMVHRFGESAYTDGYQVYTTITQELQQCAQQAFCDNLFKYDRRHGYRGVTAQLWLPHETPWTKGQIQEQLKKQSEHKRLKAAVVVSVEPQQAKAILADGSEIILPWSTIRWARPFINDYKQGPPPQQIDDVITPGAQIWVTSVHHHWGLAQIPDVDSALVAIDPDNGAIKALVGGVDFNHSAFNRVIQSARPLGSSVKPFIYAAALEKGWTLASLLSDLPITRWQQNAGQEWRPKNFPRRYEGQLRLRVGLARSKNVMAVRAIRAIGVDFAADYLKRFGFPSTAIQRTESLALGSVASTPLQLVRGYAVFTNGGFLIEPFFIDRIVDAQGNTIESANPKIACRDSQLPAIYAPPEKANVLTLFPRERLQQDERTQIVTKPQIRWLNPPLSLEQQRYAPRVVSQQVAFLIQDALISAIWGEKGAQWRGTGWSATKMLKRRDIGGKSGTTNHTKDAWFVGFGPGIVAAVWIGFDHYQRELGHSSPYQQLVPAPESGAEGGAKSAQRAWNMLMQCALKRVPEKPLTIPEGIIQICIDMQSGQLATQATSGTRMEYFIAGTEPTQQSTCIEKSLLFDQED